MKNSFKNIFDALITTIIGTATMVITLVLIVTKAISFKWDGAIGLAIGCILLITPKFIEKALIELIKAWGKRAGNMLGFGGSSDSEIKSE